MEPNEIKKIFTVLSFLLKNVYFILKSKKFLATSKIIVDIFQEVLDFINTETKFELLAVCTDHATNLFKAFNPQDQKSSQFLNNQFFEWVGCFAHLCNLGINDLFELEEFCIYYINLNEILEICKNLSFSKKAPSFSKTRWQSYSKCIIFLNEMKDEIISFFVQEKQNLKNTQEKIEKFKNC